MQGKSLHMSVAGWMSACTFRNTCQASCSHIISQTAISAFVNKLWGN